jgi:iron complex outermembrane receptor protein
MNSNGTTPSNVGHSVRRTISLLIAACAGATSMGVHAQSSADPSAGTLEEIVVTAQRREESLAKTAISVTAITAEALDRNNVQQIDDVLVDVPSVTLSRGPVGSFVTIRGISSIQGGGEMDPGLAFNVDGVYNPFLSASLMSFFDLDRVEVLRGPQGTLYGRNAIAGVVNVITKDPDFAGFDGKMRVSYGNYDAVTTTAAVNIPVTDRVAMRVIGNYQTRDGFLKNGNDDQNTMSWRAKLLARPLDDLKLGFTFETARYWGRGPSTSPIKPFADDPWIGMPDLAPPFQRVHYYGYSGLVEWDAGPVVVTYIPAYKSNDWDNQATTGTILSRTSVYDTQRTHELRFASNDPGSPFRWQGGAYYYDARNRQSLNFPFASIRQSVVTESVAAFFQTDYSLDERTRLTGGLRFTHDSKLENGVNSLPNGMVVGTINDHKSDWDSWTYKVGVERDVLDASMLYANVSTGFKAGGITLTIGPEGAFDPEKLTAYQVGMKNRLLGGRLSLDSELYYYDYSNYQAAYTSLNPVFGGNIRVVANAGAAKIKGGEIESSFMVTPSDLLTASVSYIDGKFGTYIVPDGVGGAFDYSGSKLPQGKWKLGASYRRFISLGELGRISPSLSVNFRSEGYMDSRQYGTAGAWGPAGTYVSPISHRGGVTKFDGAVSYENPTGRVQVTGFINNITNKPVFASVNSNAPYNGYLEPPRTYGVTVDVRFKP